MVAVLPARIEKTPVLPPPSMTIDRPLPSIVMGLAPPLPIVNTEATVIVPLRPNVMVVALELSVDGRPERAAGAGAASA